MNKANSEEELIQTDIDKLLKLLDEKRSINVLDLAKKLGVKVEQVEEWAKILEDHGLVEIEYPIIGLPKVKKKCLKKS